MLKTTGAILAHAVRDFSRSWKELAAADLSWRLAAFAALTPGTLLLMRWAVAREGGGVVADTEIATVLLTTLPGISVLLFGGAVLAAITALEVTCLMGIGFAAAEGKSLDALRALLFALSRAPRVVATTVHMVARLVAGFLPFAAGGGLVWFVFLREHDINYYLSRRPPAFLAAAVLVALLAVGFVLVLARTAVRWAFVLPIVLFEDVLPRRAFAESRRRSEGDRPVVLLALGAWLAFSAGLLALTAWLPAVLGRAVAPSTGGTLAGIVAFVAGLAAFWGLLGLAAGIVNASLFSLAALRLYLAVGEPKDPRAPGVTSEEAPAVSLRTRRRLLASAAAVAVLAIVAAVLFAAAPARTSQPVAVIAHRGASVEAPENTLAAFRLAIDQKTDWVELDVQESRDGEVVVVHDSDLMKLGGDATKIWEADTAHLRSVDIGSRTGPQFASERVPTLAEALATCKGRSRMIVELKSYGHAVRLEEQVVALVEAAGMADDCAFMSLDHAMVRTLKELRPSWRVGVLAAKAIGDLTKLRADFVAVEKKMATRRFVRTAHRAGQEVYVWTVDDPAWMLTMMSRGVDGLITNRPALARKTIARRAEMSEAQRVLVALLVRLGAPTEALVSEEALRP
jgi:glycerophosphoryl diester phosphodiesterase